MKRFLLVLLLSVAAVPAVGDTILVVGDSISAAYNIPLDAGWVSLLRERLEERRPGQYQVINASISGDTTAGGADRLPGLLAKHNPDKVVLELGGNDGLRGLSLKRMEANLQRMIDLSRGAGARVVLISVQLPVSYGKFFLERYNDVFERLARRNDLPLASLGYGLLDDPSLVQSDGIHPTAEAQPLLVDALWPYIVGKSQEQAREARQS
jgi:acyl-CoA thioesterase-1